MKMVVNKAFGGFHLPKEFCYHYHLDSYGYVDRTSPELVAFIESRGGTHIDNYSKLVVVEIPDSCTDWELNDYDGLETVIYVTDGKIHHA